MGMRLDKFLSESSPYSRKEIKTFIRKKEVEINGRTALRPEEQVNENDEVCVCGKRVEYMKYVYFMLNKPQGYISATEDKHYPVVTELVPEEYSHYSVFPVGRLDIDTEGLLILTNDGELDHRVTSPKKNVYKRYFVRTDKPVAQEDIQIFATGMSFKEFTAKPAKLEICADPHESYVEIAEGKFHQVKRMFERVGKEVVYLKRVSIGALELREDLKPGEICRLERHELELLFKNAKK